MISRPSIAVYRLPMTEEPVLVLQHSGLPETVPTLGQLGGKKGFVMVPFRSSAETPILVIRPDRVITGWPQAEEVMQSLSWEEQRGTAAFPGQGDDGKGSYTEAFGRFIAPLRAGEFEKLVLSRRSSCNLPEGWSPWEAFKTACRAYPRMMITLCSTPMTGIWLGCTPEVLLKGNGNSWSTVALAGTMQLREGTEQEWSAKNLKEQALVTRYLEETLRPFAQQITQEGPYTAQAAHLVHLKTDIRFTLQPDAQIGELLAALHPTPAVCGLPKQEAFDFICAQEGHERSYYSGVVGWLDDSRTAGTPSTETSLFVNLRCMHVNGTRMDLYAGGGLLPSSELASEWEETCIKMNTILKLNERYVQ